MVAIFYKWLLGDGFYIGEDVEEETETEEGEVCYISSLPLLRELTDTLPPEPTEEDEPHLNEGGL